MAKPEALAEKRQALLVERPLETETILVCTGTGCVANRSLEVADALARELEAQGSKAAVKLGVKKTGCHGFCEKGPQVILHPSGTYYTRVKPEDAAEIVEKTVVGGEVIRRLLYMDPAAKKKVENYTEVPFYAQQTRSVLGRLGKVDPEEIRDYVAHGGYAALAKVLASMKPEQVIDEVERSGLRGRGGGGFLTGRKWRACREAGGETRYLLCNGDEGGPGSFMDRSVMEGDPHAVIEGMIIGAYAVGAHKAWIYTRDEYPLALRRLGRAIEEAREWGLLGENILGSGFDLEVEICRGGGAFVCGESSALMASVEGRVGEPRAKYVHSAEQGVFGKPTVLNNVETWANVPIVISRGADEFAAQGTGRSGGTKNFALSGKVKNTGLVEVPMGTTLRRIVFDIGGGMPKKRVFKAVQTGGPAGGCLPESELDLPIDYETLIESGSMMGSGCLTVMDEHTCMVDVALYFVRFLLDESCGKCLPCREGLRQLALLLEKFTQREGARQDLDRIEALARVVKDTSLCGLGRSAVNPVLSTLRYFRHEYEAHIEGNCPGGVCKPLSTFWIDGTLCNGCRKCAKACPVDAIEGELKKPHEIVPELCTKCGACRDCCPTDAVKVN